MSILRRTCCGIFALAVFGMGCGCSSHIAVHEIAYDHMDKLNGVPVQLAAQQQVSVYQLQSDGSYAQVEVTQYPIADQSRLFSVGISADLFANATLTLAMNADGTLGNAGITSTPSGATALTNLGTGLSTVATAATTYDLQRQKAEQTALQQALATTQAKQAIPAAGNAAILAYHQAILAVLQQQALIANPPATSTPVDIANAQSQLMLLEYQANAAASTLGLPPPYPAANQVPR